MSTSRWPEVESVLEKVLDLPRDQRRSALDTLCAGDEELRSEVETFLSFDQDADLEASPVPQFSSTLVGQQLGAYRVLKEIGRGGMGVVYLAERSDQLFDKQVAIKVLETVFRPAQLVKRFSAERRILASLDHPAIAHLMDAGLTADGNPYFVLELVEGTNLSEYLKRNAPPQRQRLALFLKISDAVSSAHRKLVVHLDLKPGNIMVREDGSPKLLDFGVAKILDAETGQEQRSAEPLAKILTPAYASPELRSGEAVSVASDVYSLGVIAYEMLTGQRPTSDASGTLSGRSDLSLILDKALEHDPAKRYRSVDQFADDIRHFLANEPVVARAGNWWYVSRLFVARNRFRVAAAMLALVGILSALAAAIYQSRVAERRLNDVHQLANSLLFELHDAIQTLPGSTGARALVLQKAGQYLNSISKEAGHDRDLQRDLAQSYLRLGDVEGLYFESNLGQTKQAKESYRKALAIYQSLADAPHILPMAQLDLIEAHIRVATALNGLQDRQAALGHLQQAESIAKGVLIKIPPVEIALGKIEFGRAEAYEGLGRMPEALDARLRALAQLKKIAEGHPDNDKIKRFVGLAHKRYGSSLVKAGQIKEGIAEINQAIAIDRASGNHALNAVGQADLALDLTYLGVARQQGGDPAGALEALRQSLDLYRKLVESDRKNSRAFYFFLSTEEKLGVLLLQQGQSAEAQACFKEAIAAAAQLDSPPRDIALELEQIRYQLARTASH